MCKDFNPWCDFLPQYAHFTTIFTLWKYCWSLLNIYKHHFSRNCVRSQFLSLIRLSKDGHRNSLSSVLYIYIYVIYICVTTKFSDSCEIPSSPRPTQTQVGRRGILCTFDHFSAIWHFDSMAVTRIVRTWSLLELTQVAQRHLKGIWQYPWISVTVCAVC